LLPFPDHKAHRANDEHVLSRAVR